MNRTAARNPDFKAAVRASFARQRMMATLGAELMEVLPGQVTIRMPYSSQLSQQHEFVHAGAITSIVDSACGYAALSLMPPGHDVLTIEYKVNFLNPARGESFIATGRVIRSGRTITVCQGEVQAQQDGSLATIAVMQASMIALAGS